MTTNKELRELAEKATPGKWDLSVHTNPVGSFDAKRDDWTISVGGMRIVAMEDGFRNASDVRFIAAANPATVLTLLNNIESLQAECEALRKDAEPDVSELVGALERIARHPRTRGDELGYAGCRNIAKEALAAHRKQGGSND